MPFGRRKKKNLISYLKSLLLFLISFSRTRKYISLSLKRLKGSPYALAVGFATGIAISFTPFLGLHTLISMAISWGLRGSLAAAVIGTFFGNPWTFPFIWFFSLEIGQYFDRSIVYVDNNISFFAIKNELATLVIIFKNLFITLDLKEIANNLGSLKLIPIMTIGCIPLVIISWVISYFFIFNIIDTYQKRLIKKRQNAIRN